MFSTLATKEDVEKINEKVEYLLKENKDLTDKVQILTKKCNDLERQVQDVYMWRNSGNCIVKMNRSQDINEAKRRVLSTCAELSEQANVVPESAIHEMKTLSSRKQTFKVYVGDANLVRKIIHNPSRLRGTDVIITKDLPRQMREQQSKLLMEKSTAKLKVRDNVMTDGRVKFTWTDDGLKVVSGESLDVALAKYDQTIEELEDFLSTKRKQERSSEVIQSEMRNENSSVNRS